MEILSNNSFAMLEKSMDFLWTKQAAILDNIANVETPNYKTKVVTFEETLRERLEAARNTDAPRQAVREILENCEFGVVDVKESTRMDDNGVNLTEQSTELIRNTYQLQYVMQAISSEISELRTVISG